MKNTTDKKLEACPERSRRVFVAMSGGVDSSVSAALLKEAGFDVTGVYMKQWSPKVLGTECLWKQDRQDAMRVCAKLGIPFLTWDYSKEYERKVGKYMIDSYKKGITPNPDVMCNKVIKFGLFFDKAIKAGADFIATGHYAQISLGNKIFSLSGTPLAQRASRPQSALKSLLPRSVKLLKAVDSNKDQVYFLYELSKKQLAKTIFPVGSLTKPEVRKLAKKFGLENAEKKDSQGVCFIGPLNMKLFLKQYIKPKKGNIVLLESNSGSRSSLRGASRRRGNLVIGQHDGSYYYTIGQRHGLDIKDGHGPYFVVKKDLKKNIVYVGRDIDLLGKKAKVLKINWIQKPKKFPINIEAQIRYRSKPVKAKLDKTGNLTFAKPTRAITPGQSVVFYKGKEVLGGGIIE